MNYFNKIKSFVLLFALALICFNQQTVQAKNIHKIIKSASQEIRNFNGIASGGPINVVVKMGNTESIKFEGDEEAIATLITEVKGNVLIIRPQISWMSWEKKYEGKKITAYVTAKELSNITMSGSGKIVVNGALKNNEISINISGSGNIKVNSDSEKLNARMSGSGTLDITGDAKTANIAISGSAKFDGKGFNVEDLSAKISGSGAIYIHANENINAIISGSGNIRYSGNPQIEKTVLGSGTIKKMSN